MTGAAGRRGSAKSVSAPRRSAPLAQKPGAEARPQVPSAGWPANLWRASGLHRDRSRAAKESTEPHLGRKPNVVPPGCGLASGFRLPKLVVYLFRGGDNSGSLASTLL